MRRVATAAKAKASEEPASGIVYSPDFRPVPPEGCTEREASRWIFRVELGIKRRMRQDEAIRLANRLLARDRGGDQRRMCVECAHLDNRGVCVKARALKASERYEPVQDILCNCPLFAWRMPKAGNQSGG